MALIRSSLGFRVSVFNTAYFAGLGFNAPYLPVLLHAGGYSDTEIGIVLSTALYMRVLVLPSISGWTDRMANRATAVKLLAVVALVAFAAFTVSHVYVAVLASAVVFTLASQCIAPIGDTIALTMERRGVASYGPLRAIGSASFLFANLAGGVVLARAGNVGIIAAIGIAFALTIVAAMILPPTSGRNTAPVGTTAAPSPHGALWRRRDIMIVLIANSLIQGSHAVLNGFVTLYWQEQAFSNEAIGALWATGVISEIILFQFVAPRLRSYDPRLLMVLGALIAILRWVLFPFQLGMIWTFLIQTMHGGSWALAHVSTMRYVMARVGDDQAAAAQGLNVVLIGLTLASCTVISGPIFHSFAGLAFLPMALPALMGGALAYLASRRGPWRVEFPA